MLPGSLISWLSRSEEPLQRSEIFVGKHVHVSSDWLSIMTIYRARYLKGKEPRAYQRDFSTLDNTVDFLEALYALGRSLVIEQKPSGDETAARSPSHVAPGSTWPAGRGVPKTRQCRANSERCLQARFDASIHPA